MYLLHLPEPSATLQVTYLKFTRPLNEESSTGIARYCEELEQRFREHGVLAVLALAPHYIFSLRQLELGALQALRARLESRCIARKFSLELALRIAARRQIRDLVNTFLPHPGLTSLLILILWRGRPSETVLEECYQVLLTLFRKLGEVHPAPLDEILTLTEERIEVIRKWYGITEVELRTTLGRDVGEKLEKCVLTKIALTAFAV